MGDPELLSIVFQRLVSGSIGMPEEWPVSHRDIYPEAYFDTRCTYCGTEYLSTTYCLNAGSVELGAHAPACCPEGCDQWLFGEPLHKDNEE